MKEIIVGPNEEGKRLDGFLTGVLKEASKGFIYKMLRKKNITLNGKKAEGKEKLSQGDSIRIFFSDETYEKMKGASKDTRSKNSCSVTDKFGKLPVIYEDENIVLVNKPAGVLSQKAKPEDLSLNEWLIEYLLQKGEISAESLETYRPSICNRLDRNTSGLVVCAKNLAGARYMNELIRDRGVDKFYRTIVYGRVDKGLLLKGYLYKDESSNKVSIKATDPGDDRYSYIETEYNPLQYLSNENLTLMEIKLITGKPHQIRAHLSSIGHPIIGDIKYGGKKYGKLNYQLLHSYRLEFPEDMKEPCKELSGKKFIAELPAVFTEILKRG
jgi:23S rRNA pseudouridine955/2504/2580 synthase